jgi:3-oxoacyl-[acyl-carrier-protein] synthase II
MTPVAVTGAAAVLEDGLAAALDALPEAVRVRAVRAEQVTQLALVAAGGALAQAGYVELGGPPRPRFGVALGTAFGCFLTNASYQHRVAADGARAASPRLFAATVSNAAAGEVGIGYRLGGPAVTLSAGAAAGLFAIGHGADLIAGGRADVMVAGGMDARGPELERWLADGGLATGEAPISGAAAVVVLETGPVTGRWAAVLGHAEGFTRGGDTRGVTAAIRRALDDAGMGAGDLAVVASIGPPGAADPVERALGAMSSRLIRPREAAEAFAAGGPLALLATLDGAPVDAPVLVLQICTSGHVAAVVAARAGNA